MTTLIAYCHGCRLEFTSPHLTKRQKPFCPRCMKRTRHLPYPASPAVAQCRHCGCAPCDCETLYRKETPYDE